MEEFINEYKHLEKICNELFGGKHGVTQYIEAMERVPGVVARSIPGWINDMTQLKRLRHIRNAMVHDTSGVDVDYTDQDIVFLKSFYQRIMSQQDPLSLLRSHAKQYSVTDDRSIEKSDGKGKRLSDDPMRKPIHYVIYLLGVLALIALIIGIAALISNI